MPNVFSYLEHKFSWLEKATVVLGSVLLKFDTYIPPLSNAITYIPTGYLLR